MLIRDTCNENNKNTAADHITHASKPASEVTTGLALVLKACCKQGLCMNVYRMDRLEFQCVFRRGGILVHCLQNYLLRNYMWGESVLVYVLCFRC